MEQIKAPTPRQLRAFGGSAERYYEFEKARLVALATAEAFNASPEGKMETALLAVGGKLWEKEDKRRVYFNSEFLANGACATGYFDVRTGEWVVVGGSKNVTAETFAAEMIAKTGRNK